MPRRKSGLFEDLIDIASLLPPWLSLILAALAYFILHQYAISDVAPIENPTSQAARLTPVFYKALATFGQYVLPMAFLFGAIISFTKRRKRSALIIQTRARGEVSALLNMNWQEFEQLVGEAFKHQGYAITETGANGPDGGVDLILTKNNETFLVQCKQWRAQKVGVNIVRELYGVMAAQGATGGFIVTSGTFTSDAIAFADGRNIELIGGDKLMTFIIPRNSVEKITQVPSIPYVLSSNPPCPACGSTMVRRVASKGKNAGNAFWGCPSFPKCRGTLNL